MQPVLREGYTMKFFFQGISWNTVSGSFRETWNTFMKYFYFSIQHSEAVVQMYPVKKAFLEMSQNSQEITCTRASFLIIRAWGLQLYSKKVSGNFVEFPRKHFLTERLWWLLLNIHCVFFSSTKKLCLQKKDIV